MAEAEVGNFALTDFSRYYELAETIKQKQAEFALLEAELLQAMQDHGVSAIDLAEQEVTISLKRVRGREQPSQRLTELRGELAAEQEEMLNVNAERIYELNKQIFLAENQLQLLSTNQHVDAIKAAIVHEQNSLVSIPRYKLEVIPHRSPDVAKELGLSTAELAQLLAEGQALANECSRSLTKAQTLAFLRAYAKTQAICLKDAEFEAAWNQRKFEHVNYWKTH